MKRISKDEILVIHHEMIVRYGGVDGLRDKNLFESECVMPYQTFAGEDLFPDLYDKAVRYLFGFAGNQIFVDGNKRTGTMVMAVFLMGNGINLSLTNDEMIILGFGVSEHELSEKTVKQILITHTYSE